MHINRNPEYFLTVAELGSFSKAAEKLYVSQPYLSQHVLRLEKELGVPLLDRSRTPLRLTEAGRVYANYLESGKRLEQKLLSDLAELSQSREQTLRLALSSWRAGVLLPDILPVYAAQYPQVRLDVMEYPTSELYGLVLGDRADLAVMNTSLDTPEGITAETLLHEHILLVGNRRNPVTQAFLAARERGAPIDLHALENERVVLMRPGTFLANRVRNFLDREQVTLRRVTYGTNAATALGLAARNYGFCFLNETGVRSAPGDELAFFDFDTPDMTHPLCAVYKSSSYLRPITRAFIDVTADFYAKSSMR
ncbi:MAG: LysR family transcriptional regulator [Oscillospiraceae bacterium]|nr:LysR family transcriptional regulator [Oscillospiraceae bacterium]